MKTFSMTDTGRVRSGNQDSIYCEDSVVGSFPNLFIVADGMGGHRGGDIASKLCIKSVVEQISQSTKKTPVSVFEEAVAYANRAILEQSLSDQAYRGMGTTMVGATIQNQTAYVVNVGDSRLYKLDDTLRQITVDHSLVEEMVQSGEIAKDQMRTHPNKNIITRALGTDEDVRPDCFEIEVEEGDVLLLCSDGLTNMLDDRRIEFILKQLGEDLESAGKMLVNEANEAGGKDNISVVLIRV